jgi:anion-transporting  ArsA/GET3 family ATPase
VTAQERPRSLIERLEGRKVILCVGSGGVGKTTTAAALALRLAAGGKRALVLTIDPARRLADSLGLSSLGNLETRIELSPLGGVGVSARGELFAMVLDHKLAWDELVRRDAKSQEQVKEILENRLYQTASTVLAGSLEYMAMERVAGLSRSGRYDVIVVDTPPTSNALDFLEAPDRVLDLLDNDAMRIVLGPLLKAGKATLPFFLGPARFVLSTLARFTGMGLLEDMARFMVAFEGMYGGFRERAGEVKRLLHSPEAGFVLVTSPSPLTVDEALFFHRALKEAKLETVAVVINRLELDPRRYGGPEQQRPLAKALSQAQLPDLPAALPPGEPEAPESQRLLSERLARTLSEQAALADVDRREADRLQHTLAGVPIYTVPQLRRDVHDLLGLWQIDQARTTL